MLAQLIYAFIVAALAALASPAPSAAAEAACPGVAGSGLSLDSIRQGHRRRQTLSVTDLSETAVAGECSRSNRSSRSKP